MRRGLAGLILGFSLVIASVAWAGFVMNRTVLDPGRSERLADQIFENPTLRGALVSRLSAAMGAALPEGAPEVPNQTLEDAASIALDNPAVEALIRDGIVATHRAALEGDVEPTTIDSTALGAAVRDALVAAQPELGAVVPEVPPVEITLPTSGLSKLGVLKDFVERATIVLAAVAAIGALSAFVITNRRAAVLRRVAFWAFGTAAFWIVVGYGIPFLAEKLAPASTSIVSALIDVFFGAMIRPGVIMAIAGAVLFGASILWDQMAVRRPAAVLQPRAAAQQPVQRSAPAQPRTEPAAYRAPTPAPRTSAQRAPAQPAPAQQNPAQQNPSNQSVGQQPPTQAATPQTPSSSIWAEGTTGPPSATPKPTPQEPRGWVEGVGYVESDSGDEPRTDR